MKLILLGAPGAGKGTQAEIICEHLGIPVIGTGNIIRAAVKNGTDMGKKAQSYMEKGELVPDEVVIGMLKERMAEGDCDHGFILDGFPRTVVQALALESMGIEIDRVIDIEVSDETILKRISGRRVCKSCGSSSHIFYNPTQVEGVCDKCGGETAVREDDQPETVRSRLAIYHDQTEPLKDFYQERGKLYVVEGQEEIVDTTRLTLAALEESK